MEPATIRWGILATGSIAQTFAKDLLVDPTTRDVHTVKHTVVAAASSSGLERAQDFLKSVGASSTAKAYGTYKELAEDNQVDIIYVSTPHSHHYQNVNLCLESGKNVLCEKAFTVNAAQAKELVRIAREKNLFLMEALWTRYFPLSIYARETITSGKLGTVMRTFADNSLNLEPQNFSKDSRMIDPKLAGGSLLDMGIYSLTWVFQTLYTTQPLEMRKAPYVTSIVQRYEATGVDETVNIILSFPRDAESGGDMHGITTTSFRVANDIDNKGTSGPAVRIQGTKGELQVWPPIFRPTRTRLILADGTIEDKTWPVPGPGAGSNWYNGYSGNGLNAEGEGHGMFWEADEAAMALLEGRKEGKYEGLDESVVIMEVMDEVRRQNGLTYPSEVEATETIQL
ncbi:hypothetical protein TMatcc_003598 [Talaromyces marneffei ATCC 18224]|uniref:D-xylose 1-dehydrogenase (NADP(+), D-xylono-1,5-lactone-forming) n=1 Tax=Talaromyces marneffei (strain ATCC 18224 / CBS 334.59 / QM 7333) TaxID=441960 RepID=B6Q3L0_TALMQ|nr:dimeric dihydrodiol dehydrogenase, putative [Talaromyces marneffei ATCC 18224]KAE8556258.1 hypothetical protein EYB25_000959 [Talaromyces marneffei]